jgi:hypothetical protein
MTCQKTLTGTSSGSFWIIAYGTRTVRGTAANRLYLPLANSSCQLILIYEGADIVGLKRGPAYDAAAWGARGAISFVKSLSKQMPAHLLYNPRPREQATR